MHALTRANAVADRARTQDTTSNLVPSDSYTLAPHGTLSWRIRGAVLLIILVAFALRVYRLDFQSLWVEEMFSIDFYLDKGLIDILRFNITAGDPQMPLYFILLHYWGVSAGSTTFALRFLSVLPSIVIVPAMFILGRRLFGRRVGLAAALFTAVNPFFVWYAQEVRTYSLTAALTLVSTICCIQAFATVNRRRWLAAYALTTTLAIYSHYFAYLVVAAQAIVVIVFLWRAAPVAGSRQALRDWLIAMAVLFVPYLPWLPFAYSTIGRFQGWHPPVTPLEILRVPLQAFSLGTSVPQPIADRLFIGFAALAAVGLILLLARKRPTTPSQPFGPRAGGLIALLLLTVPFAGVALFISITGRVIFHERYFIIAAPMFLLLLGAAIGFQPWTDRARLRTTGGFGRRALPGLQVVALLFIIATSAVSLRNHYFDPEFAKADYRAMLASVHSLWLPGDAMITTDRGLELVLRYYVEQQELPMPVDVVDSVDELEGRMQELTRESRRIWFVPYLDSKADLSVLGWLDRHGYRARYQWFTKGQIYLHTLARDQSVPVQPANIHYAGIADIDRIALPTDPVLSGTEVPIGLQMPMTPAAASGYRLTLDLVDPWGNRIERAYWPLTGPNSAAAPAVGSDGFRHVGVPVPGGTPPGVYNVYATLDPADGGPPVNVVTDDGAPLDTRALLGQVTIAANPDGPKPEIGRTINHAFGPLVLLGVDLPSGKIQAGDRFDVGLYWQAREPLSERLQMTLRFVNSQASIVAEATDEPVRSTYPTSNWAPGEIVRDIRSIRLEPSAASGIVSVVVQVRDEAGRPVGSEMPIGTIEVEARPLVTELPPIQNSLEVQFDDVATLRGYDVVKGEDSSHTIVNLYWQALETPETEYRTFVHLLDQSGNIVVQHDGPPDRGNAPTTGWRPHEVVVDPHPLEFDANQLSSGEYRLRIGMYAAETLVRLPVTIHSRGAAADDRSVITPPIQIKLN